MTGDHVEIAGAIARLEQKIDDGHADVSEIKRAIVGNGKPGLLLDVDRIKQREASRSRLAWLAVTASASALVGMGLAVFRFFFASR